MYEWPRKQKASRKVLVVHKSSSDIHMRLDTGSRRYITPNNCIITLYWTLPKGIHSSVDMVIWLEAEGRRFVIRFSAGLDNLSLLQTCCRWVPVTTAWRVLRLRMEERPPIWSVAANILNKQSRTAEKGWSFSLGIGLGDNKSSLWKQMFVTKHSQTKSRTWARLGEEKGVYRVLVEKPEGKRPLGRPTRRWEDNIRMDLQEVGCGGFGLDLSSSG
jgi:hypothetical protein